MAVNVLSPYNTTNVPLAGGASWNGTGENVLVYTETTVNFYGEPLGATGTLFFEYSSDNSNWDVSVPVVVSDPTFAVPIPLRTVLPYFRVRYVNDATPQTSLRITTVHHSSAAKHLTRFPNQTIGDNEPVEMTRSFLSGQNPTGRMARSR